MIKTGKPIHLVLSQDKTRMLKQGYPWIHAHNLEGLPDADSGVVAVLKDKAGTIIAKGLYDPESHLAFRVFTTGKENLDSEVIAKRIKSALKFRRDAFDASTTGYRMINGEGDLLPGLIVDRYGDVAVMQYDGAGPRNFYEHKAIAKEIVESGLVTSVYYKPRHNDAEKGYVLEGNIPNLEVEFLENNARFSVNIKEGQKTGFFLDQRDNRLKIRSVARNLRVLNIFSYTGGFSINAGLGGATEVTSVDLAKPAIDAANKQWQLNGLNEQSHTGIAADAFKFIEEAKAAKKIWDLVIVDPPSFTHSESSLEAARSSYLSLITSAIGLVRPGGLIAASSCTSRVTPVMFLEICEKAVSASRRQGVALAISGQPEDHPFPLACHELRYLKFILIRVA
jgi:23S rRNA (cytosine1962-C5)-methyltransferase